jgi:hypothetical protein
MEKLLKAPLPHVLFLFFWAPRVFVITGCLKNSDSNPPLLSVLPDVLDFGKVRPTDSPVKLTFDISNNSGKSIAIADIVSCCGCSVIDIPQEPIPPNGKVAANVLVNVLGRSGLFENDLLIKPTVGNPLQVPIRGNVETDIWTNGQALRCTVAPSEQRATTTLIVYTAKYPDIVFVEDQRADDITLTEISRVTQNGETAIRFSVAVDVGDNDLVMRNINVVPADISISPLTIPFYCHREE